MICPGKEVGSCGDDADCEFTTQRRLRGNNDEKRQINVYFQFSNRPLLLFPLFEAGGQMGIETLKKTNILQNAECGIKMDFPRVSFL